MSASCASTICTTTSSGPSAISPKPRASTSRCASIRGCRKSMVTDSKRLQQILKNLLSNAFKFTHSGQVTLTRRDRQGRLGSRQRGSQPRRRCGRLQRHRHRHRHLQRQAADHLRGLPAGRRQHQPQVRRHRSGPGHQPRAVAAAGRRNRLVSSPGRGSSFTLYLPHDLHARRAHARRASRSRRFASWMAAPPTRHRPAT